MGMYTSVVLEDGKELQIKCGFDDCEVYRVGDYVNWRIWPDLPGTGKLLDGIYYADTGDVVVIKDHRIFFAGKPAGAFNAVEFLPWERNWWSETAWLEKETEDAKRNLELAEEHVANLKEEIEFLKTLRGEPAEVIVAKRKEFAQNRVARAFSDALKLTLSRQSFTRSLLKVQEAGGQG